MPVTKTCQQSHNVNGVTFVTRKHMSLEGPIFIFLQDFLGCLFENFFFYFLTCLFLGGIGHKDASITDTH